jgi:riboflavin biosynthesis pyrimidine reductase
VQSLFPASPSELSDEDLVGLYAYPVERTWVRANFVSTVDGAVQGPDGRSGSVSTAPDRRLFAILRSLCDVVLVGAGTARREGYQPVQPHEVDTELRRRFGLAPLPAIAVVTRSADLPETLTRGEGGPVLVIGPDPGEEAVDPAAAVERLSQAGHQRILCEGGPRLMHDLVASGRCDEVCLSITPMLVSGDGYRMTRGALLDPPVPLALQHLLEQDGTLFCRYTRVRG